MMRWKMMMIDVRDKGVDGKAGWTSGTRQILLNKCEIGTISLDSRCFPVDSRCFTVDSRSQVGRRVHDKFC